MRYLKLFKTNFLTHNTSRLPVWNAACNGKFRFLSQDVASGAGGSLSRYDPLQSRSDMEELFLDKRVRYLLKRLTGYNPAKVFEAKSLQNLNSPKYRFMTDEQLKMVTFKLAFI